MGRVGFEPTTPRSRRPLMSASVFSRVLSQAVATAPGGMHGSSVLYKVYGGASLPPQPRFAQGACSLALFPLFFSLMFRLYPSKKKRSVRVLRGGPARSHGNGTLPVAE